MKQQDKLVYVIGNDMFPGYYKIGYTSDLKKRLSTFNSNSGVCSSYRCYIVWYVDKTCFDKEIHGILDTLNPSLRVKKNSFGGVKNTEFYNISLEKIWSFLYGLSNVLDSCSDLYRVEYKDDVLYKYNDINGYSLLFGDNNKLNDDVSRLAKPSTVDNLLSWWKDEGSQVNYVWDRLPWCLLYGSYKWWMNGVFGYCDMGIKKFSKEFRCNILPNIEDIWNIPNGDSFTVGNRWDVSEPLIGKYKIDELRNPCYKGEDWNKIGSNGGQYKRSYKGLVRMV